MPANIFVVGLDATNHRKLDELPGADRYRFHPLLDAAELTRGTVEFEESLNQAEAELQAFDGPVDAIVGYWDFPISSLAPILCHRRGLPTPSLDTILMCEHKYWSRLKQHESITEHPKFALLDLDATRPPPEVPYPMWIKPVKSMSSELAFHVVDDDQLRTGLSTIREGIGRVGNAFDAALAHITTPPEIAGIG